MSVLNFTGIEATIAGSIDTAVTSSLANIYAQGNEFFRPVFVFYVVMLGFAIWRGAVEITYKEFMKHIVVIFVIFSLGLNAFGYTFWVQGVFTDVPNDLARLISPDFQSISQMLDKQATDIIRLNQKITDGNNMIVGVLLSGVNTALALTYGVTLFAIYLMTKVATGVLISIGPAMFLTLLSEKTKGWFERWFIQLVSFQMTFMLIVAYLAIFSTLIDDAIITVSTDSEAYRLKELAPIYAVTLLMILGAKQIKEMAAAISGGMSLSATGGIGRAANYSRESIYQSLNIGKTASRSLMNTANRFNGSGQTNQIKR
jgi:type IV secretory pathway VirB6-like protein